MIGLVTIDFQVKESLEIDLHIIMVQEDLVAKEDSETDQGIVVEIDSVTDLLIIDPLMVDLEIAGLEEKENLVIDQVITTQVSLETDLHTTDLLMIIDQVKEDLETDLHIIGPLMADLEITDLGEKEDSVTDLLTIELLMVDQVRIDFQVKESLETDLLIIIMVQEDSVEKEDLEIDQDTAAEIDLETGHLIIDLLTVDQVMDLET
eukprot:TRINITY_DN9747_c0_g1_i1.p2 TRINITY_DN9747_c0_g1~~TRINITY_DN9747_c0_g1_i1.p2  ORF type:complete len:206 (+),score=11.31 TRINITY_DN9747_c0_g1_i1:505-1122(+)